MKNSTEREGEKPSEAAIEDPAMNSLPRLGQVLSPEFGKARMKKTVESKKNGANNETRAVQRINKAVERAEKQDDLVGQLTESVKRAKVKKDKEKKPMAAKKKTSANPKPSSASAQGLKVAEPIGRERKILIRLSDEEYKNLQKTSKQKGISMAMVLRSGIRA